MGLYVNVGSCRDGAGLWWAETSVCRSFSLEEYRGTWSRFQDKENVPDSKEMVRAFLLCVRTTERQKLNLPKTVVLNVARKLSCP